MTAERGQTSLQSKINRGHAATRQVMACRVEIDISLMTEGLVTCSNVSISKAICLFVWHRPICRDAVKPGAEGRLPGVKRRQGAEDAQKNALGQIHCVLLFSNLSVNKDIDLVVMGANQFVGRLSGAMPQDVPYPLVLLFHGLIALPNLYIRMTG